MKIAALADNPSRAGMLRHALHRGGHVVRCFGCGKSMTDAVRDARYDVLLLDRAVHDRRRDGRSSATC